MLIGKRKLVFEKEKCRAHSIGRQKELNKAKEITLLADMPGVKAGDLNIDLRDDTLTLTGVVAPFEGPEEEDLRIEYEVGTYYRQFTMSELIDQSKIDAQLSDGVLRLSLPKVEKATPRKITVKAG
jgi:HSP20 family molecular chaperone IbpA